MFQFYIVAIDRSWKPLSSRALVTVSVSYTNIERRLGFSLPVRYISIVEENIIGSTSEVITNLDVTNTNSLLQVVCEILAINGAANNNLNPGFGKCILLDSSSCGIVTRAKRFGFKI